MKLFYQLFTFLDAVATVDVLTGSNNDVKLVETRTVHFARLKMPSCFERINKLDRDIYLPLPPSKSILKRVQR